MYYTTPVYQFRMKCHLCDNYIEIKTDPANLDYEIISGARRQERRWDPTENGQVVPDDKNDIKKRWDDAMFKLEHGEEDLAKKTDAKPRLQKLTHIQGTENTFDFILKAWCLIEVERFKFNLIDVLDQF